MEGRMEGEVQQEEEQEPDFGKVFKDAASFWTQKPPQSEKDGWGE